MPEPLRRSRVLFRQLYSPARSRPLQVASIVGLLIASPQLHGTGGDSCEKAVVIPALPYVDTGDTTFFANTYAPACPFGRPSDSAAEDVVYRYVPARREIVTISLCGSSFDTKLYVFQDVCPVGPDPGNPVACSDDDCFGPSGRTLQSHLDGVALAAGSTYYIVVDGFKNERGPYVLTVTSLGCGDCDPGGASEDEPNCGLGQDGQPDDFINGGCNASVPIFSPIKGGQTVCGTTASNPATGARDTDWYQLVLVEESVVSWQVTAEARSLVGIVDNGGVPDCEGVLCFIDFTEAAACQAGRVSAALGPGTWWLYVAPFFQDEEQCTSAYTARVDVRVAADLDGDGVVGPLDLSLLVDSWGPCPAPPRQCTADIDTDGTVGVTDLLILLRQWG